ncbi:hypothetical protein [Bradyrhizobium sp.]|uniref:hypothetical protein n=1 Tax=Bradyrhizobium sp. TaxID=376 RepID=UPI00262755CD|nr:hypothetical protein [Bradyrhizobium sp.]
MAATANEPAQTVDAGSLTLAWQASRTVDPANQRGKTVAACLRGSQLAHATRIFIPQHTTTSATMMQVAVRAFSKADEAIAMLSFAYPTETLGDSAAIPQLGNGRYQQPEQARNRKGTNAFARTVPWEL